MADPRIVKLVPPAVGLVACGRCGVQHDAADAYILVEDRSAILICPACAGAPRSTDDQDA